MQGGYETSSSAAAEKPRDALCPSVVSLNKNNSCGVSYFIQIGPPSAEKMTSCRFSRQRVSTTLDFKGSIMGSLKSPCRTSYRSSTETMAVNCFVFEKIAFFCILATDRQTNRQTDRRTDGHSESLIVTEASDLPLRNVVFGVTLRLLVIHFVVVSRHQQTRPLTND